MYTGNLSKVSRQDVKVFTISLEMNPELYKECLYGGSLNAYKVNVCAFRSDLAIKKAKELCTSGSVSTLCTVPENLTNISSEKSGGGDTSGGAPKHNINIMRFKTKKTREQPMSEEIASIVLGESLEHTRDSRYEMKSKKPKSCIPSAYTCFSSHQTIDFSNQPDHEDIRDETLEDVTLGSKKARPFIPTGSGFQANIPIWIAHTKMGKIYGSPRDSNTLRWLGTIVWPTYILQKEAQHKGVGEGRHDSCSCDSKGSSNCIKQHKKETRELLEKEFGREFYTMEFDGMGEVVANLWTTKEEQRFSSLVKKYPLESSEWFWEIVSKAFPRKAKKDLISYYQNVFLINRMRMLADSSGDHIDSDDDHNGDFLGQ